MFRRHSFRKPGVWAAAILTAFLPFLSPGPAFAVTNFTVTVVASGGANENTNWTFANGEITPSANVSINASEIVSRLGAGPVVVYSGRILVNANVIHATGNDLTFKATGNIIVGGGLTIQSQGGDIVFNSDSDANNIGHVRFGFDATCTMGNVNTNGGDIIVGGGANPRTTSAWAQNSDLHPTTCLAQGPLAGVAIYNFSLNASGGDISVRGQSPTISGNPSARGINMNASGGLTSVFQTSGSGTIYFFGDGSQIGNNTAWGVAVNAPISVTTASGAITFEGRGNPSGPTNARGVAIGSASTFTSSTGNISLIDRTNGALAGYTGIFVGGAMAVATNGNFTIQADEIFQTGALNLDVDSASIGSNTTSSFTAVYSTGVINAASSNALRIGSPGNTSAITIGGAVTSGGPITMEASAITINQALTATGSNISLKTTSGVTQNAVITASALNLMGTATYNPQSFTVAGGTAQTAFTATYDSQGGSAISSTVFAAGSILSLPSGPTRSGYDFLGWAESASGSVVSAPFTPPSRDLTLFAQWRPTPPPAVSNPDPAPALSAPVRAPVPSLEVSSVRVAPGKEPGSSLLRLRLSNSKPGVLDSKVQIKLFDTTGKLLKVLTVPVTDDTGSLEVELALPLGEFTVQASTVNSAGGSSQAVVNAAPVLQKPFFTKAVGNRAPVLAGTRAASPVGFAGNSSALSPAARTALKNLATKLRSTNGRIALTGFSAQQAGTSSSDKALATRRASAVAKFLKRQGVRIPIFYAGYGALNESQAAGLPRKVEIRLIK